MPTYDYACACGHRCEAMARMRDLSPKPCPACGKTTLKRQFTLPSPEQARFVVNSAQVAAITHGYPRRDWTLPRQFNPDTGKKEIPVITSRQHEREWEAGRYTGGERMRRD